MSPADTTENDTDDPPNEEEDSANEEDYPFPEEFDDIPVPNFITDETPNETSKKRFLIMGIAGLLVAGGGYYYFSAPSEEAIQEAVQKTQNQISEQNTQGARVGSLNVQSTQRGGGLNALGTGAGSTITSSVTPETAQEAASPPVKKSQQVTTITLPSSTVASYRVFADHALGAPLEIAVPEPKLLELSTDTKEKLPLPQVYEEQGLAPWSHYRRPYERSRNNKDAPEVGLIVTGLGLSRADSMSAIMKLHPHISLSFSPYASGLNEWMLRARRAGHEVILQLPLESSIGNSYRDQGPMALRTTMKNEEIIEALKSIMRRQQGYFALEITGGDKFSRYAQNLIRVFNEVNDRGVAIIGNRWTNLGIIRRIAQETHAIYAISDLRLDSPKVLSVVRTRFDELNVLAQQKRRAIGTIGVSPMILQEIINWERQLAQNGLILVPVSFLLEEIPNEG